MSILWDCHERGAHVDPPPVTREETPDDAPEGDPGWFEAHAELADLHTSKAAGYGSDDDALANYVETSAAVEMPSEFTCWLRIHEKCIRALNLVRAGKAAECDEAMDVAALALACEALRRRRL